MSLLPLAVTKALGQTAFAMQRNSPQLLFGAGIVGMLSSTVLACRATLKVDDVLEEGQRELAKVKACNVDTYTEQDRKRDITIVYAQTTLKIARLYAPAIVAGGVGVVCLSGSHRILTQRNAALMAAYAAVEKAFGEYRERVVDKYGEDQDREFRYGTETVEVVNPESGRRTKATRVASGEPSMYARFFDKASEIWSKDPEVNYAVIRNYQRTANDLLLARGHLFLNEVYDMLGLERSTAGSVVGWRMTPNHEGDNYVDFGLFRDDGAVRDFMNGREGSILLDFNVDGVIYDKIDTPRESVRWQQP